MEESGFDKGLKTRREVLGAAYVDKAIASQTPLDAVLRTTIEQCGRSRIPLNGVVQQLHRANLYYLSQIKSGATPARTH